MTVTQVPIRPVAKATRLRLLAGLVVLMAAGAGLAWAGTSPLRPEVTATGVQFRTVQAGEGPFITMNDAALIEYTGTFDNGEVFDSTAGKGPAPMSPQGVIPGFAEALQKMQKGGTYKFRLPPELAYGASPPPGFPANAALNFEVKVLQVAPGAAAMLGAGGGQPR
ncbi:FKBP-type peptidyl-prolyl cis-trans isomerase [Sphingomonas sp. GCM10030256]|uniref:FKBP-type peptidyl-prolyl cis-trans isomerase n=1 Tax=Sphingomonas sp. GCM10030256 TaxID=3273427 RepID=UPI00361CC8E7